MRHSVVVALAAITVSLPPAGFAADNKATPTPAPAATATAAAASTPAPAATPASTPNPVPAIALAAPPPRVRSEHSVTAMGAIWRSALLPGWGQRYKGEKTKGWVFTGVAGGLAATSIGLYQYKASARDSYNSLGPSASAKTFDDRYKQSVNAQLAFDFVGAATAGWWAYSVSDSAFTPLEHLRIKEAHVKDVFPAQYKYYEGNPFATISVENRSNEPVSKVKLKVEAKDIMDLPAESAVTEQIPPGLGKQLTVNAAFNNKIFEIGQSEPRSVPAKITIEYEVGNKKRKIERTAAFTVYNRNAIVWDDMRKLASFVTPKDDAVKNFAAAAIGADKRNVSSVKKIAMAARFFESMGASKIQYLADPNAPFTYFEGNAEAVDTVSFPRETLVRKAGDCDDLTSLYAALLESAGISTGLVDVPGHVFVVLDTEMTEDEVRRYIGGQALAYQMREGTAWIPVEVTAVGSNFVHAWEAASTEYKKWNALKKFNVVETEESQTEFPPSPPSFANMKAPDTNEFARALDSTSFLALSKQDHDALIGGEEKAHREAIAAIRARKLPQASEANEIGIIYARDAQFDEAEKSFRQAIAADPRLAKAHNNLANILYLLGKNIPAAEEYEKALDTGGENAAILANLANLWYEAGEPDKAKLFFARCLRIDSHYESEYPEIASLLKPDAAGTTVAAGKTTGPTKASNIGAGERDPRKQKWIP